MYMDDFNPQNLYIHDSSAEGSNGFCDGELPRDDVVLSHHLILTKNLLQNVDYLAKLSNRKCLWFSNYDNKNLDMKDCYLFCVGRKDNLDKISL